MGNHGANSISTFMATNIIIYKDNIPLTYILTSAKLDATGHHWVASLANYIFALSYQSGKMNEDADALCLIPNGSMISILKLTLFTP